jgi:hypothetical protein
MNKYIFGTFLSIISCALLLQGCSKDDRDINENLTEVTTLFTPNDALSIKLDPSSGGVQVFEWDQARAADGSLVLYEIAFDQANGDFSNPFYTVLSDNKGILNKATLTHGDLNNIAKIGGSEFFEKKTFKWTVLASKGTNRVQAKESRTIELERPGGFDDIPGSVYLTGSATEGGTDLANAQKLHMVSPGVFEIYSKLTAGTYHFVDATSGTPKTFYIFENGGINRLGVGGETTFSGPDKIMRIRINFNDINASFREIKSIQFWYAQGNEFWFTLPYTSNGIWRYNNWTTNLITMPWGREERYKYKMVYNDGSGDKDLWLNSNFGDPPGQDGAYPSSVEYRSINLDKNDGSQFDNGWKLDRNYLTQGVKADFWVSFRGSDPAYTQQYQKQ